MYNDNRDHKAVIKTKYHRHTESMVKVFCDMFSGGKVIDIGTRDGYAVELLKKNGFSALGTDIIKKFVDYAKSKGRRVKLDDIMDCQLRDRKFNYVFSRHCIEHSRNPVRFLYHANRILQTNGRIFITFPLETKAQAKKNEYHLCNFATKNDFRKIADRYFDEVIFEDSEKYGIIPDGKDVLYIGVKIGLY